MSKIANILDQRSGEIWSVRSDQSVLDAVKLMAHKGVGALLVIDDGNLEGIFSERDYARKVILDDRSSKDTPVGDIMTRNPVTITRNNDVNESLTLMSDNDFRHLPVVEDGTVVGMISIGDLVKVIIREQQYTIDQLEHYIAG